jgi:hypothetical protein
LKRAWPYLIVVFALIGVYTLVCALADARYLSTRTVQINAPSVQISELLGDFHSWANWNPLFFADSTMNTLISGEAMTVDHTMQVVYRGITEEFRIAALFSKEFKMDEIRITQHVKGQKSHAGLIQFSMKTKSNGVTTLTSEVVQGEIPFWYRGMLWMTQSQHHLDEWNEDGLKRLKNLAEGGLNNP